MNLWFPRGALGDSEKVPELDQGTPRSDIKISDTRYPSWMGPKPGFLQFDVGHFHWRARTGRRFAAHEFEDFFQELNVLFVGHGIVLKD